MLAKVAVEKISYFADEMYSYSVPKEYGNTINVGSRVIVPFGKGDCLRFGVVTELESGNKENLKEIIVVLDEVPLISSKEISILLLIQSPRLIYFVIFTQNCICIAFNPI